MDKKLDADSDEIDVLTLFFIFTIGFFILFGLIYWINKSRMESWGSADVFQTNPLVIIGILLLYLAMPLYLVYQYYKYKKL